MMRAHLPRLSRQTILLVLFLLAVGLFGRYATREYLDYSARASADVREDLLARAQNRAGRVDALLKEAKVIADVTAQVMMVDKHLDEQELYALLQRTVSNSPLVYGAAIAFEPGVFKNRPLFCPYVYRAGDGLKSLDIGAEAYDYTKPEWEWYVRPKALGASLWTEPYFDEGAGNILMVTYSVPFYRDGTFAGIATVDLDLGRLPSLAGISKSPGELHFILSKTGHYVYSAEAKQITRSLHAVGGWGSRPNLDRMARIVESGGEQLVESTNSRAETLWSVFSPIHAAPWSFVISQDKAEALRGIRQVRQQLLSLAALTLVLSVVFLGGIWHQFAQLRRSAARVLSESRQREDAQTALMQDLKSRAEIARIGLEIQEASNVEAVVRVFLGSLGKLLDMRYGAVFVADEDRRSLHLAGSYAAGAEVVNAAPLAFGESLVGQCALEHRKIVLELPADTRWRIFSGLGSSAPRSVMILPALYRDTLVAVVEVATLDQLTESQHRLLDELVSVLAMNLKIQLRKNESDAVGSGMPDVHGAS